MTQPQFNKQLHGEDAIAFTKGLPRLEDMILERAAKSFPECAKTLCKGWWKFEKMNTIKVDKEISRLIFAYQHRITKLYLFIDDIGQVWVSMGNESGVPVSKEWALKEIERVTNGVSS